MMKKNRFIPTVGEMQLLMCSEEELSANKELLDTLNGMFPCEEKETVSLKK